MQCCSEAANPRYGYALSRQRVRWPQRFAPRAPGAGATTGGTGAGAPGGGAPATHLLRCQASSAKSGLAAHRDVFVAIGEFGHDGAADAGFGLRHQALQLRLRVARFLRSVSSCLQS